MGVFRCAPKCTTFLALLDLTPGSTLTLLLPPTFQSEEVKKVVAKSMEAELKWGWKDVKEQLATT